jgi:molecular chaperone HtpG
MDGVKFLRIDADSAALKAENAETYDTEELKNIFGEIAAKGTKISFEALTDETVPAILSVSEQSRRIEDMMRLYGMSDAPAMPQDATFVVNTSSPLVRKLAEAAKNDPESTKKTASYIYKLSLLSQKNSPRRKSAEFMKDSVELLMKL